MQIKCGQPTIEDILQNDIVVLNIDRETIETLDTKKTGIFFNNLKKCGLKGREKAVLMFDGYEEIADEVFEIEAIRKWSQKLFSEYPHLFYFINNIDGSRDRLACCLGNIQYINTINPNKEFIVKVTLPQNISQKIIMSTICYGFDIGETEESIVKLVLSVPGLSV